MEDNILRLPEIGQKRMEFEYFPTRMQAVVFKNWDIVPKERIAACLKCDVKDIEKQAEKMGLQPQGEVSRWLERGYISIIKANWQILPYKQLLTLLGWTAAKLAFVLKEEDFLEVKLGKSGKHECEEVIYRELTEAEEEQTQWIKNVVQNNFTVYETDKEPFDFFTSKETREAKAIIRSDKTWKISDETGDIYVDTMVNRFTKDFGNLLGIVSEGENDIILKLFKEKHEEEYHEIRFDENEIIITADDSAGILRALTYISDIVLAKGCFSFEKGLVKRKPRFKTRLIYSFCGLYNDALDADSRIHCPDELLRQYAKVGINGIWIQAVLYRLTEFPFLPSISQGWEKRLARLRDFAERAKAYGIKIYLYINEPRAMPPAFFENHPHLRGHEPHSQYHCLCTSTPEVQKYLYEGIKKVCEAVPDLGGFFTITRSENLTNCYSATTKPNCPRCAERAIYDVLAEVNGIIASAAHAVNPEIKVIAWDWAWRDDNDPNLMNGEATQKCIEAMPKEVILMCNRERALPTNIGGIKGEVNDYAISVGGISRYSSEEWKWAKNTGHETAVKLQINNSWECSTIPYLPVYSLLEGIMHDVADAGVEHLMLSWTLGGYPSPNIKIISDGFFETEGALVPNDIYETLHGADAEAVKRATVLFSEAFREYPFSIQTVYNGPANGGAANPLFDKPSGYQSTMTGYAYDDLARWRSIYPEAVFENQFRLMCEKWKKGLEVIADIADKEFISMAEATYIQLRSSYNQIRFIRARDVEDKPLMRDIAQEEMELAAELHKIMQSYPAVGFEAANHYYYTQGMLKEKVINCAYLCKKLG